MDEDESELFEDAKPAGELAAEQMSDSFQPLEIPQDIDPDVVDEWYGTTMPANWLFSTEPRRTLIAYALQVVSTTEPEEITYQNKTELSEEMDLSRHSIVRYIDDLVEAEIYEESGEKRPIYRPNPNSEILSIIHLLNEQILGMELADNE